MFASPRVDTVMAQERAHSFTRRSIKTSSKLAALKLALSMLDLTTLEGKDSPEKARSLCFKARRPFDRDEEVLGERLPACAAVCVYPALIPTCMQALGRSSSSSPTHNSQLTTHSPVRIASVATGFPSGQYPQIGRAHV